MNPALERLSRPRSGSTTPASAPGVTTDESTVAHRATTASRPPSSDIGARSAQRLNTPLSSLSRTGSTASSRAASVTALVLSPTAATEDVAAVRKDLEAGESTAGREAAAMLRAVDTGIADLGRLAQRTSGGDAAQGRAAGGTPTRRTSLPDHLAGEAQQILATMLTQVSTSLRKTESHGGQAGTPGTATRAEDDIDAHEAIADITGVIGTEAAHRSRSASRSGATAEAADAATQAAAAAWLQDLARAKTPSRPATPAAASPTAAETGPGSGNGQITALLSSTATHLETLAGHIIRAASTENASFAGSPGGTRATTGRLPIHLAPKVADIQASLRAEYADPAANSSAEEHAAEMDDIIGTVASVLGADAAQRARAAHRSGSAEEATQANAMADAADALHDQVSSGTSIPRAPSRTSTEQISPGTSIPQALSRTSTGQISPGTSIRQVPPRNAVPVATSQVATLPAMQRGSIQEISETGSTRPSGFQHLSLEETSTTRRAELQNTLTRCAKMVAGHVMFQAVSCGVPTFMREVVATAISEGLKSRPGVALGIQGALVAGKFVAEYNRRDLLARHPDEAAASAHGLTAEQWSSKTPVEQEALRKNVRLHSNIITGMQLVTSAGQLALGGYGVHHPASGIAQTTAAGEFRNLIYGLLREPLQGQYGLTTTSGAPQTNGKNLAVSAGYYSLLQGAGSVANSLIAHKLGLNKDVAIATNTITSLGGAQLDKGTVIALAATVAFTRGAVNTVLETIEAIAQGEMQTKQARDAGQSDTQQKWAVTRKKGDMARTADHAVVRHGWNNTATMISTAITAGLDAAGYANPIGRGAASAVGQSFAFGASYFSVNRIYQAHAGERKATREARRIASQAAQSSV